jgi:four helix bundle protein
MGRDHRKLRVFALADQLVLDVYARTARFPSEERFEIRSQIRRAAVSVATNIVEGCARRTTRDYLHFMNIATGSAAEALYLLDLSARLGFLRAEVYREFAPKYNLLLRGLQKLIATLEREA